MTRGILALGLVALGCSAGSDGGDDGPERTEEFTCDPRRQGTYRMSFLWVDGNCGEQAGFVGRIDNDVPVNPDCVFLAPDVWSADGCKLERSLQCPADGIGPGYETMTTAVTTQKSPASITGVMTLNVIAPDGVLECTGTYNIWADKL
jgi:hypothetical protein